MNYVELTEAIKRYCENEETSFVAHIPDFVKLAEQRIYNSTLLPVLRRNKTGALTQGNKYLTLPTDWLATYSLSVIAPVSLEQTYLLRKDVEFIRESFPPPNNLGVPQYYAQFDENTLLLGPTPDAGYAIELHYFYYPETIVTASTTWLGNNFDSVLLYGALREAYLYMKGEADIIAEYEKKYQESLLLLKSLGEGKNKQDFYRPMRGVQ